MCKGISGCAMVQRVCKGVQGASSVCARVPAGMQGYQRVQVSAGLKIQQQSIKKHIKSISKAYVKHCNMV
jgi:hypothetical protein